MYVYIYIYIYIYIYVHIYYIYIWLRLSRLSIHFMAGIHEQLLRSGVKQIVAALEAAKSSYLKPFLDLSRMIQVYPHDIIVYL